MAGDYLNNGLPFGFPLKSLFCQWGGDWVVSVGISVDQSQTPGSLRDGIQSDRIGWSPLPWLKYISSKSIEIVGP